MSDSHLASSIEANARRMVKHKHTRPSVRGGTSGCGKGSLKCFAVNPEQHPWAQNVFVSETDFEAFELALVLTLTLI